MKSKNSQDLTNWNMTLLKHLIDILAIPLCYIFNLCIDWNRFPSAMKIAIIKPLYKNNDKHIIYIYRPISYYPKLLKYLKN